MAHSMSWGPPKCSWTATAMRASDSTSSSLKQGADASSWGSGSSRTPPFRGGDHHGGLKGGGPQADVKLGVSLDGYGLGRGPAVHEAGAKALDHMDQNHPGIRVGRVGCVHDPAGDRVRHDQEADRHGARSEFVELPIVDRLGGKKAFHHLPVGGDQALPLHVENGKKLTGEGIGRVLADGAGAHGHGRRRAKGPERAGRRRRGWTSRWSRE